jgi:hypothetical protein
MFHKQILIFTYVAQRLPAILLGSNAVAWAGGSISRLQSVIVASLDLNRYRGGHDQPTGLYTSLRNSNRLRKSGRPHASKSDRRGRNGSHPDGDRVHARQIYKAR